MLSPVLLDELRAHWRRLRKKSDNWLFPGNRWHSGDQPIDTKTPRHACQYAARRAGIKKKSFSQQWASETNTLVSGPAATRELARIIADAAPYPLNFRRTIALLETREGVTLVGGGERFFLPY